MRLALAIFALVTGAAIEPDAVLAGPRRCAGTGPTSTTRLPSSRNVPASGNTRRLPNRSSSVTASFSQPTTAPQNSAALSSTTSPFSASIRGGSAGRRDGAASTSWLYCLLRTSSPSSAHRGPLCPP